MERHSPAAFVRMRSESQPFGRGGESPEGYAGITSKLSPLETREGWLTERALEWLDSDRDPDRPLMLYLSFDFPHAPFNVPARYEQMYELADIPEQPLPPWDDHPPGHVGRDPRRADAWDALQFQSVVLDIEPDGKAARIEPVTRPCKEPSGDRTGASA